VDADEARSRFAAARVARLATRGADGRPHVVPMTFALLGAERIVSAVDRKPKRTPALKRLANIAAEPRVAVLADAYDDADWSRLWWVRADGVARAVAPGDEPALREEAIAALAARYEQYAQDRPSGTIVLIDVERWSGWAASSG
jgi:PPOX class probable F420-dependent enzyme